MGYIFHYRFFFWFPPLILGFGGSSQRTAQTDISATEIKATAGKSHRKTSEAKFLKSQNDSWAKGIKSFMLRFLIVWFHWPSWCFESMSYRAQKKAIAMRLAKHGPPTYLTLFFSTDFLASFAAAAHRTSACHFSENGRIAGCSTD